VSEDFDKVLHNFGEMGAQYATAKAKRTKLECVVKSVKAEAYLKARAAGKTVSDADAVSRTAAEYLMAMADLVAAIEDEEAKSIKVEALRVWMDWARTKEATRREEMRLAR
jgi:hypothetical protein